MVNPFIPSGFNNLKFMLSGFYYTLALSLSAIAISIVVGLLVALPGLSENRLLHAFNRGYVELVRAIPILVLILWIYYGLPPVTGITIGVFAAGVMALAISDSPFQGEIFRAGIQSIDKGQYEAAHSLSLSYIDAMRHVVI